MCIVKVELIVLIYISLECLSRMLGAACINRPKLCSNIFGTKETRVWSVPQQWNVPQQLQVCMQTQAHCSKSQSTHLLFTANNVRGPLSIEAGFGLHSAWPQVPQGMTAREQRGAGKRHVWQEEEHTGQ